MNSIKKGFSIGQTIIISMILIVGISLSTVTVSEFITFSNTTNDLVENTSREINKQIILNYENYIDSIIETGNYIQIQTVEYGIENNNTELGEIYSQAADIQKDVVSIVLLSISGDLVVKSGNKTLSTDDLTKRDWYTNALNDDSIYHFSSHHIQDVFQDSTEEVITMTKLVDYYVDGNKYRGVLVVDLNIVNLVKLSETTNLGEEGHIIILNNDDTLIYSSSDACVDSECESIQFVKEIIIGGQKVEINDLSMYANVNTLKNTRWRIATFYNVEIIDSTRNNTLLVGGLILIITLIVTGTVTTIISNRISSPITKLKNHMQLIQKGNLYKKIEIEGQREIVVLANSFNIMIEEIRELIDTVFYEQKEKRKSEFIALQTQINPHFLYNTLDSIVYLSENNMNEKVVEMVVALSKFFRISISRGKNIILLSEELEHAKNYLLIQKIRYHDKFTFEFEIDEDVKAYKTVKLILQPLIENAIYHGINTEYNQGKIIIRAYKKEDYLILEVEDDGYGITDPKIQELYDRMKNSDKLKSVGLRNVYQRLKLYYGENTNFEIDSELDIKTIMRILIPIERAR
jgi:two-component system sensor histidine kinase YesM